MRWQTFELFEEVGLTLYERKALVTLMTQGIADAETLCRIGEIPSSKIYRAMEKLHQMGLCGTQPSRPKLYSALAADQVVSRLVEISRQKADSFALQMDKLRATLAALPERARGRSAFVDLAMGAESHVRRHLTHLAGAQRRIWSYMEHGDLSAITESAAAGFPVLRRIARNAAEHEIDHRVVFGFEYQSAGRLVAFLRSQRAHLEHVTGVRYSGELGHPFHVVDDDLVILSLDHPFVPGGRVASLMLRDQELAGRLEEGFQVLWARAMKDLREVDFHPR